MMLVFWYFFIYAFLGWCAEVIYAAVKTGHFVNRGFLNGPLCPIYGVGILFVLYLLNPVKENLFYMFIGSILITSSIELITGFLMEKIFHQKWWDYSEMPFNIGGYICPMYSLLWGLACLVIVDRIHPIIFLLIHWIPQTVSILLLTLFACLFVMDLSATVQSVLKLNKKLEILDEITSKIRETSESIGENLANGAIALVQKKGHLEHSLQARKQALSDLYKAKKELLETHSFGHKRLLRAFPGLKSIKHKDALEKLKQALQHGLSTSDIVQKSRNDHHENKGY